MFIVEGLLAGLFAGIIMISINQIGYRFNIMKCNLVIVDGSFALKQLRRNMENTLVYALGSAVHLATSALFGIVYVVIAELTGFDNGLSTAVALYVLLLWLSMLFLALPVSGQGLTGSKIGRFVWLEQLILHIFFGFSFWWALNIV